MFKDKILAELKKKFPGLPANILGSVATKLAEKVTEETAIEGAITELDNLPISLTDYAKLLQQETDRRVTEAKKKWDSTKKPGSESDDDIKDDDKDETGKDSGLAKQFAQLQKEFLALKQKDTQKGLSEKLHEKLKEKKIPLQLAKGVLLEKDEDLDSAVQTIEAEYTAFKQDLINQGLMTTTSPQEAGGGVKTEALDADIAAWASAGKPKEEKK